MSDRDEGQSDRDKGQEGQCLTVMKDRKDSLTVVKDSLTVMKDSLIVMKDNLTELTTGDCLEDHCKV